MKKEEIIKYIRKHDSFFENAQLGNYSYHELMLIRISIDVEKAKYNNEEYIRPMEKAENYL